jgi:thiosulfate/3-mercaptopyruvate sulfurtransferase
VPRSACFTNSAMLLLLASHIASGTLVSPGWLQSQLAAGASQLCILDVTQRLEAADNTVSADADGFAAAHIPGARFVDVGGRLSRQDQRTAEGALLHNMLPGAAQFATELGEAGVRDESHVVLYSSTKVMWATRVWWMLRSFGFRGELSVLDGGLKAWTAAGGEVATEEVRVSRVRGRGRGRGRGRVRVRVGVRVRWSGFRVRV